MAETVLEQNCQAVRAGNATIFEIVSALVSVQTGELPHSEIFVHTIVEATDPKADTFVRIADLVDLTTVSRSRAIALQNGLTQYLSSRFRVTFTDVTTAIQARSLIQTKVNNLINQWIAYEQDFTTNPSTTLPLVESSVMQAAADEYKKAKAAVAKATEALDAAQRAVADAKKDASHANDLLTLYTNLSLECATVSAMVAPARLESDGTLSAANVQALQVKLNQTCAQRLSDVIAKTTEKAAADSTAAAAQSTNALAEKAATAATATAETKLATVLELCPTFDPTTV